MSCALAPATQRRQVLTPEGTPTATSPGSGLPDRPVAGSVVGAGASASPVPLRALDAVLPCGATAPSVGRAYTRAFAGECDQFSEQTVETGELLVSELVTNAFQATCSPVPTPSGPRREPAVRLSLRCFPGELLIEVIDHSPDLPAAPNPNPSRESEHGRGLMLIEVLSQEWGWFPVPGGGKCVYCRLATEI